MDKLEDNTGTTDNEIMRYVKAPLLVIGEETIGKGTPNKYVEEKLLSFWKENSKNFPTLSLIAKDYLSIMPTSVSSERAFSLAGLTVKKTRSRLHPDTAKELLCSQSWNKIL